MLGLGLAQEPVEQSCPYETRSPCHEQGLSLIIIPYHGWRDWLYKSGFDRGVKRGKKKTSTGKLITIEARSGSCREYKGES